jgi:hypothetical protein
LHADNKSGSSPSSPRKAAHTIGKGKRAKGIQRLKMVPQRRESEVLANRLPELDLQEVETSVDHKAGMHVVETRDRKHLSSKVGQC